jgi:hypothetical protein
MKYILEIYMPLEYYERLRFLRLTSFELKKGKQYMFERERVY